MVAPSELTEIQAQRVEIVQYQQNLVDNGFFYIDEDGHLASNLPIGALVEQQSIDSD